MLKGAITMYISTVVDLLSRIFPFIFTNEYDNIISQNHHTVTYMYAD